MLPRLKVKILKNCQQHKVILHYEDEIFDKTIFTFENYTIKQEHKSVIINGIELFLDNIMRINAYLPIEKSKELISQSESIEEALHYTQEIMPNDIEVELELLKEKLLPKSIERNVNVLRQRIIGFKAHYKGIENVLFNLLVNICDNGKIVSMAQNEMVTKISDEEIKKAIKNYEEEIF